MATVRTKGGKSQSRHYAHSAERDQATSDLFLVGEEQSKVGNSKWWNSETVRTRCRAAHTNSMAGVQTILKANLKLTEANRRSGRIAPQRGTHPAFRSTLQWISKNSNNNKTIGPQPTEPQDSAKRCIAPPERSLRLLKTTKTMLAAKSHKARVSPPGVNEGKGYANAADSRQSSAKPASFPTAVRIGRD
jgi:hypothetical protein